MQIDGNAVIPAGTKPDVSLAKVLGQNDLVITQELMSTLLGVRRESITQTASKLKKDGLIAYARGHMTIMDRHKLEKRVCECYSTVKMEYDRLLPHPKNAANTP